MDAVPDIVPRSDQCCQPTWECWKEFVYDADKPTPKKMKKERKERKVCCMLRYVQSCPCAGSSHSQEWFEPPKCSNPEDRVHWDDRDVEDALDGKRCQV